MSSEVTNEQLISLVSSWWEREGQYIYPWARLEDLKGNYLHSFGGIKENNNTIYSNGN